MNDTLKVNDVKSRPIMSRDPIERAIAQIQMYDPSITMLGIQQMLDYPVATEFELIKNYLYGGARPFVDFLVYIDLGVGWTYRAVDFDDEEQGKEAIKKAKDFEKLIELSATLNRFATFYEVLGRACIIKTRNLAGGFLQDKNAGVKGVDCINPMTLSMSSLQKVMEDITGAELFQQVGPDGNDAFFTQDRVYYKTQNNLSGDRSIVGSSKMQNCVEEFRTLQKFPKYRSKLGRIYSEIIQVIKVDTSLMTGETKDKLMDDNKEAQKYLDQIADYYRTLSEKGSVSAAFEWLEVVNTSFAGKEVKLDNLEDKTLNAIARSFGVPLSLVDSSASEVMNRATLEAITDTYVARQENGTRTLIYKPLIEDIINEYLESEGITKGRLEIIFNPFLSDNLLEAAQIISLIWQTGAMSKPEVRSKLQLPEEIDMGGKQWDDMEEEPMPTAPAPANQPMKGEDQSNNVPALDNQGEPTQPDGNQNARGQNQKKIDEIKKQMEFLGLVKRVA